MPANTVYVGRGSKWGNPYRVIRKKSGVYVIERLRVRSHEHKIDAIKYSIEFYESRVLRTHPALDLSELKGKDLACWCAEDMPCHGDILLELANK